MTLDEFFSGRGESRWVLDTLHATIDALGGSVEIRVTKG
jgi:hypothetical protein